MFSPTEDYLNPELLNNYLMLVCCDKPLSFYTVSVNVWFKCQRHMKKSSTPSAVSVATRSLGIAICAYLAVAVWSVLIFFGSIRCPFFSIAPAEGEAIKRAAICFFVVLHEEDVSRRKHAPCPAIKWVQQRETNQTRM